MKRLIVCFLLLISACLALSSCAGGGEWYLEQQTDRELPSPSIPLSMRGYSVNTPKTQTATADGLEITAELFCDGYSLDEVMQARFTVKNASDSVIYINGKTGTDQGSIFRGDGEVLEYYVLSEEETASNASDDIKLIALEPGETVVRERVYVLRPDFFEDTDKKFTLVYSCDALDGQDATVVLGTCRLEIELTVDK